MNFIDWREDGLETSVELLEEDSELCDCTCGCMKNSATDRLGAGASSKRTSDLEAFGLGACTELLGVAFEVGSNILFEPRREPLDEGRDAFVDARPDNFEGLIIRW